jgi:hypothetical protein
VAIFCDSVAAGVIITKPSSSSVNSWSSSESSFLTSSAFSVTSVRSCYGVRIGASWLVVSWVCVKGMTRMYIQLYYNNVREN